MANSTGRRSAAKLPDGFPLWKHPSGRWCKKVKGRAFYFGKIEADPDGQAALARWLAEKDDLLAGRKPRQQSDELTVRDLANRYMTRKGQQRDAGEITATTFRSNYRACQRLVKVLGANRNVADLRPDDFSQFAAELLKLLPSPTSRRLDITICRGVFKFAFDSELIERPVRFGPAFVAPPRRVVQKALRARGTKVFERQEILEILKQSNPTVRAMVLLGINCGFGNYDCATLTHEAIDLAGGWVTHPRPKTGAERRAKLWSETIEAIKAVAELGRKPKNPDHAKLVFLTVRGKPYVREGAENWSDAARAAFDTLLEALNLRRPGRGFYGLRHTFETIAGGSKDQVAVNLVMGHTDSSMAANYRHGIEDSRLVAVAEHVRAWLFGEEGGQR